MFGKLAIMPTCNHATFIFRIFIVHLSEIYYINFFFTSLFLEVEGEADPVCVVTLLGPPTQTAFCLNEVPNGSNQDPRHNQDI